MAVNLTPQYHEAEAEYKKAQTAEERWNVSRRCGSSVPKHKASEKLQAEIKTKISETRKRSSRSAKIRKRPASATRSRGRGPAR